MKFAFAWIGDRWDVRTEPPVVWIAGQAGNLQTPKAASEYKDQMENGEAGKAMTFEEIERLTGGQQ